MATQACLRCCKRVPESAAFCRRCGLALGASPAADRFAGEPPIIPPAVRRGGSRMCFFPAFLLVAAGIGMLSASSHRQRFCGSAVRSFPSEIQDDGSAGVEPVEPRPLDPDQQFTLRHAGPPWIEGCDSRSAPAGKTITIRGRGFSNAGRVLFAAGPSARAGAARGDARFRVLDDSTIAAVVPNLGRGAREVALAVITPSGAAVTIPMDDAALGDASLPAGAAGGFVAVPEGETITPGRGATLLVERGGCAVAASNSVIFLRAGGGLERARTDCLIVRETPNPAVHDLSVTPIIEVPELRTCRVDALFHYAGRW